MQTFITAHQYRDKMKIAAKSPQELLYLVRYVWVRYTSMVKKSMALYSTGKS